MSTIDVVIPPGTRTVVPTGIALQVPFGFAAFVHPRSGLAARNGLSIVNTPGTIDSGYRGEVKVCLINTDTTTPITVRRGDRIAQLVIQAVVSAEFVEVSGLSSSERGGDGYGSTGGWAMLADDR
jgi:dUTP pyrophosphatase